MSAPPRRLLSFLRGQSTLLDFLGLKAFRPFGFYTPYRYAGDCRALGEDECIAWLREAFDAQLEDFESFIDYTGGFNERFEEFRRANPADVNQPRFNQEWFPGLDGASAYAMVMRMRPARIIEVGSGHSTRFLARAIADAGLATQLHSIDPVPRRHIDALCSQMTRSTVTQVPVETFMELGASDILFIDGSHLAMPGTDVDYLFGQVLPVLTPGVVVHVHDIFLPNGYPRVWAWRGYTEQAVLAAMLGGGRRYRVLCANAYLRRYHPQLADRVAATVLPTAMETGFWMQVQDA